MPRKSMTRKSDFPKRRKSNLPDGRTPYIAIPTATPAINAAYERALYTGEKITDTVVTMIERYENMLADELPTLPPAELARFRAILADKYVLASAFLGPRMLAAMIEDHASPRYEDEQSLRTVYSLARRVAEMRPPQALALVEATERWIRRRDSRADDLPQQEFIR